MPTLSTQPTSSKRNTATMLYESRELSAEAIAAELQRLGDSTDARDVLMRTALIEILNLRRQLSAEKTLLNTLESLGLETKGSIFGVHCATVAPAYVRRWICWRGKKHDNLRDAIREMIALRTKGGQA